jgi:hypothetical protein
METAANRQSRKSVLSDEELLRTIGEDLRALYSHVIKQPLPSKIEAALARIEIEQNVIKPRAALDAGLVPKHRYA